MLDEWDALEAALLPLERIATKGAYVEALVRAIREEVAAGRDGGPPAEHRMLKDLGYAGWSRILSLRPAGATPR